MKKKPIATSFEKIDTQEMIKIEGGIGLKYDRVVIIGCIPPFPPLQPGQVTWNPWIGQPYPYPA